MLKKKRKRKKMTSFNYFVISFDVLVNFFKFHKLTFVSLSLQSKINNWNDSLTESTKNSDLSLVIFLLN